MTVLAEEFDTDAVILAAYTLARSDFERWAAVGHGELPPDKIDATQVQLMRWQRERFGDQSDERMALGVIEEVTECNDAQTLDETEDACGDAIVYAGQLAMNNRLAIGPILKLVETYDTLDQLVSRRILKSQGTLAQTVLKGAQKIRGLDDAKRYHVRLVGSIAQCIARCMMLVDAARDDVAAPDSLYVDIDLGEIYMKVASEVLQRNVGHAAIPKLTVH